METTPAKRRIPWMLILSLALAALLLYLAFRGADWAAMLETLRGGQVEYFAAAGLALVFSYLLRSLRWRVLLSAERPAPATTVFWGTWVGYLGNSFLPARAGEVIRSVMLGRRLGISVSYILATAITERLFDAIVLVALLLMFLPALPAVPDWLNAAVRTIGIAGVVGALGIIAASRASHLIERLIDRLPLPERLRAPIQTMVERFLFGMRAFQSARRALAFCALTAAIWSVDVVIALLVGRGFHLELTVVQAILLLAALGLSSAAPSTPGYIGIYQFVAVSVLTPFGYTQDQALVFILAFQAVTYAMVLIFGLLGLWRLNTGSRGGVEAVPDSDHAP